MTVGLSANQIGIDKRISVVDLAIGRKRYSDIHVLINPEIIWRSKSILERYEGCVNLPEIWGEVKRSKRVKVNAYDRSGNKLTIDTNGWSAILLQHEIDHLYGKLFIDHLPDPTKAHYVESDQMKDYRKNYKHWHVFTDVSNWTQR